MGQSWGAIGLAACSFALAGCPAVDLGDTPADIGTCRAAGGEAYFMTDIWPTYLGGDNPNDAKSCVKSQCHTESGTSQMKFKVSPTVDYSANYQIAIQFVNCGLPEASRLLTKPLAGVDGHGGQDIFFSMSEVPVVDFLGWFK